MSLETPTLQQLFEQGLAHLQAELDALAEAPDGEVLPVDIAQSRQIKTVLAAVHSKALNGLYQYDVAISQNAVPILARNLWVVAWADSLDIDRKPEVAAQGQVDFQGTPATVIPADTIFTHPSTGVEYKLEEDATLDGGGIASGQVIAETGGSITNVIEGDQLLPTAAIAGLSTTTVGEGGLAGGEDIESIEELHGRVIEHLQHKPAGGSKRDYIRWAREVPGVKRAWAYSNPYGLGTVSVAIEGTTHTETRIAAPALVSAVTAYIEKFRPVGAHEFIVFAPEFQPVDISLTITPNTYANRTAVEAELADMFVREMWPNTILPINHIRGAISAAADLDDFVLLSPTEPVQAEHAKVLTLGSIDWV